MITDDHRAKAREIVTTALTRAASQKAARKTADLLLEMGDELDRAIAQALAEQQEKDARIAEDYPDTYASQWCRPMRAGEPCDPEAVRRGELLVDTSDAIAAAIRAGGGNERAP